MNLSSKRRAACPYCKSVVAKHSDSLKCPSCNTAHHIDCWHEAGSKCTVYGCKGRMVTAAIPQKRPRRDFYKFLKKAGETIAGYAFFIAFMCVNVIEPSGVWEFFPSFINKILVFITIGTAVGVVLFLVAGFLWALMQDLS